MPYTCYLLIFVSAHINKKASNTKQTPLHFAAKNDALKAMKKLIESHSDIEARDYKHRTPLQLAAAYGNVTSKIKPADFYCVIALAIVFKLKCINAIYRRHRLHFNFFSQLLIPVLIKRS